MNRIISGVSAAALFGVSALAGVVPATAAMPMDHSNFQQRDQFIGNFCDTHRNDSRCNDWQQHHTQWGDNQYQGFYRDHRRDSGFGNSAVAGLFGFAAGALVAGALDNGNGTYHVRACENAYRSYDVRTDTYLGYDGARHQCQL
jgi:hypothetical protein